MLYRPTLSKNTFRCIYVHVGSLLRVQLQSTKALDWDENIWVRERVLPWANIRRHSPATGYTPLVIKICPVHLSHTVVQVSKGLFECDITTSAHRQESATTPLTLQKAGPSLYQDPQVVSSLLFILSGSTTARLNHLEPQRCGSEVIVRQLYNANSLQSQEVSAPNPHKPSLSQADISAVCFPQILRIKAILRDIVFNQKITPENYIMAKAYLADEKRFLSLVSFVLDLWN